MEDRVVDHDRSRRHAIDDEVVELAVLREQIQHEGVLELLSTAQSREHVLLGFVFKDWEHRARWRLRKKGRKI